MNPSNRTFFVRALATTLAIVTVAGCTTDAGPETSAFDDWSRLRLETEAALLSGTIDLEIERIDRRVVLTTHTEAKLLGAVVARSRTRSIVDAETGRSRRYLNMSPDRGRDYRFDRAGYTVRKLDPDGNWNRPIAEWEETATETFRAPAGQEAEPIHDYYAMLLQLRRLDLDQVGDSATVRVATSRGAEGFRISVAESRENVRSFVDLESGEDRVSSLTEFRLTIAPEGDSERARGFLGMEGEIEIWVESVSKAVLEIRGQLPKVPGTTVLQLTGMAGAAQS